MANGRYYGARPMHGAESHGDFHHPQKGRGVTKKELTMRNVVFDNSCGRSSLLPCIAVAAALAALALLQDVSASNALGRCLNLAEMEATFGDGTDLCKKEFTCEQGFKTGESDCEWCSLEPAARLVCCPIGTETTCDYTGNLVCTNFARFVGPKNASYGSCLTCGSASPTQDGFCIGLRDAEGNDCP
jgi:hypothetical protein